MLMISYVTAKATNLIFYSVLPSSSHGKCIIEVMDRLLRPYLLLSVGEQLKEETSQ